MSDLVPLEAIEAAVEAAGWDWDPDGDPTIPTPGECMADIIEAAAPHIARQVGERIAEAIDAECPHGPDSHAEGCCEVCDFAFAAADIARQVVSGG